jgi:hypothetical protein
MKAHTGVMAAVLAAGCLAVAPRADAQDCDPAVLQREIAATRLDREQAVTLKNLRLGAGPASLTLTGTLIPATPVGGRPAELVFIGDGRVEFAPADDIEANQLDLFVGSRRLDETFTSAVLVFTLDAAVDALLKRPRATLEPAVAAQADTAWQGWIAGAERRLMDVPGTLLRDACGEPLAQGFAAARLTTADVGAVLLLVDPEDREQFTLGQFVPIEASAREQRKIRRALNRERRRGRLGDLDYEDLGQFDNWVSASLRSKEQPVPGISAFEPSRYVLDVTIDGDERLKATARLELRRVARGARSVSLRLPADFRVASIRSTAGADLPYLRTGSAIDVILPRETAATDTVTIEVRYDAGELARSGRAFFLADTLGWYPQAGDLDRARFDATFHWPRRLQLMAPGVRAEGGEKDGQSWERRVIDREVAGYTFEVGRFDVEEETAGRFRVRYAFDPEGRQLGKEVRQEIKESIAGALDYFEGIFGPLPLDEITVVTSPRYYSQSSFGFITLSNLMMADLDIFALLFGFEDRRTVIAHEVAHQWWGHMMAMETYHEAWLSEGLANYSALRYRRDRLKPEADKTSSGKAADKPAPLGLGPTHRWREALTAEIADGRPIEAVGPLVLGPRLSSSRADAYEPIVYRKGAVVLDMLARGLGEQGFTSGLKDIARAANGRAVSNGLFFDLLERIGSVRLEPFERRFVLGTGLPDVYYDYRFEKADAGWKVVGAARLVRPYHFRYGVAVVDGGRFDVRRVRQDTQAALDDLAIAVPIQIGFYDPARDEKKGGRRRESSEPREPNAQAKGHIALSGGGASISLPIDHEPLRFWLDRDAEVFGRFFDESRYPKRMLYYQGLDRFALGEYDEATRLFERARAAPAFGGDPEESGAPDKRTRETDQRGLDAWILLTRARMELDRGRLREAEGFLAEGRRDVRKVSELARQEVLLLENRVLLLKGSFAEAYQALDRAVRRKKTVEGPEAQALLAIAAVKAAPAADRDAALEQARKLGVDVDALTKPAPPAPAGGR